MKRPSIKSPCVADAYADKRRERIAEFSAPNGEGGLISVLQCEDGTVLVSVYSLSANVRVTTEPGKLSEQMRKEITAHAN